MLFCKLNVKSVWKWKGVMNDKVVVMFIERCIEFMIMDIIIIIMMMKL
jgi:hypothetical protein